VLLALLLHLHGLGHVSLNPSLHLGAPHLLPMSILILFFLDQSPSLLRGPIKFDEETTLHNL
jgi:hypothetical protein